MNRILSTAPELMAIMAARADSWIMLSGTSKLTVESKPRLVTRMRLLTTDADLRKVTLKLQSRVRDIEIGFNV